MICSMNTHTQGAGKKEESNQFRSSLPDRLGHPAIVKKKKKERGRIGKLGPFSSFFSSSSFIPFCTSDRMMPLICHRILFLLLSFLFIEMDESILWIDNYSNWIQLRRRRLGKGRMGKEPFDIDPNLTSRHYPPPPNHFSLNDDDGGLFIRHWSCGGRHASWVLFVSCRIPSQGFPFIFVSPLMQREWSAAGHVYNIKCQIDPASSCH